MSSPVDGFTRVERACASGHRGSFSSDERTDNGVPAGMSVRSGF